VNSETGFICQRDAPPAGPSGLRAGIPPLIHRKDAKDAKGRKG
jgi:hypothetical protein